jgi:hypothetical protein
MQSSIRAAERLSKGGTVLSVPERGSDTDVLSSRAAHSIVEELSLATGQPASATHAAIQAMVTLCLHDVSTGDDVGRSESRSMPFTCGKHTRTPSSGGLCGSPAVRHCCVREM